MANSSFPWRTFFPCWFDLLTHSLLPILILLKHCLVLQFEAGPLQLYLLVKKKNCCHHLYLNGLLRCFECKWSYLRGLRGHLWYSHSSGVPWGASLRMPVVCLPYWSWVAWEKLIKRETNSNVLFREFSSDRGVSVKRDLTVLVPQSRSPFLVWLCWRMQLSHLYSAFQQLLWKAGSVIQGIKNRKQRIFSPRFANRAVLLKRL